MLALRFFRPSIYLVWFVLTGRKEEEEEEEEEE